jgi:hypothetical protein
MDFLDTNLTFILIIFAISFALLLIGIVVTYFWIIKKYLDIKRKSGEQDLAIAQNTQNIISQAQVKAQQILQEAANKASQITNQAEMFNQKQEEAINKIIEQTKQTYAIEYKKAIEIMQTGSTKIMQTISDDIKNQMVTQVDGFRKNLQAEVVNSKEEIRKAILKAFENTDKDIEGYKKMRFEQIEKTILTMIKNITKEVLAKEISIEEHEKMVIKALEEAKKQGLLN